MTSKEFAVLEDQLAREGVSLRQMIADEIADRWAQTVLEAYESLFRWVQSMSVLLDHLLARHAGPAGPKVVSPYLNATEAAAYLRLDGVKKLYGLIERGRLKPLPGSRKLRFTKEILDECLSGDST
jgi:hypothetical protein